MTETSAFAIIVTITIVKTLTVQKIISYIEEQIQIERAQTDYHKYKDNFVKSLIDELIEDLKAKPKDNPLRVSSVRYQDKVSTKFQQLYWNFS